MEHCGFCSHAELETPGGVQPEPGEEVIICQETPDGGPIESKRSSARQPESEDEWLYSCQNHPRFGKLYT